MSTIQEIADAIRQLAPDEFAKVRQLIADLDRQNWEARVSDAAEDTDSELVGNGEPALERLRQRAKEAQKAVERAVVGMVRSINESASNADSLPPLAVQLPNLQTPQERAAAFLKWVDSHADVTAVADDSRESIYEGRGE